MTITVLGVGLELDIFDVDVYEKYEHEVNEVSRKVNEESPEGLSTAESLRYQCGVVKDFFDAVFGSGTAENLFHGKNNIRDTNNAYIAVIKAVSTEMSEYTSNVNDEFAQMSAKYAPDEEDATAVQPVGARNVAPQNLNRAQRRASGKKRKHH